MVGAFVLGCVLVFAAAGYFQGFARQVVNVAALIFAVLFAGPAAALAPDGLPEVMGVPLALAPAVKLAFGGVIVLALASAAGHLCNWLFRIGKSKDQVAKQRRQDRFRGLFFGAFKGLLVALILLMIVYNLGQVAEIVDERVQAAAAAARAEGGLAPEDGRPLPAPPRSALRRFFRAAKERIAHSALGGVVRQGSVVDADAMRALSDIIDISNDPDALRRLQQDPDVQKLAQIDSVRALIENPEIVEAAKERRFMELLDHPQVAAAANDRRVKALIKSMDFERIIAAAKGRTNSDEARPRRGD